MDFSNKDEVKLLVNRCLENDKNSQKVLFEKFHGKMITLALTYFNSKATAEDAVSEAFIKVFNKLNTFDNSGNIEGWIRRVVANQCVDIIRKNKRTLFQENEGFLDVVQDADEKEIKNIPVSDVLNMIHSLPAQYRAVFNLFVFEDMQHKDIAKSLGIAEGTSKSNFFRAKKSLKIKFNKLSQAVKCREELKV